MSSSPSDVQTGHGGSVDLQEAVAPPIYANAVKNRTNVLNCRNDVGEEGVALDDMEINGG